MNVEKQYKLLNNAVGWGVFFIALLTYILTMAKTASFWDCGEFISSANEFQVPHAPGAPFFMIVGRVFAFLSFGNDAMVAFWVNMVSATASAFTVLFIFWSITYLGKKVITSNGKLMDKSGMAAVLFAGIVGGLACTFSDSFWFNAVEAEVYALSSFFTAIVVWLMFKWEESADQPHNLRFLVAIAFLMGLSIGVHLLNLLTIPALAFIYYFRKFEVKPMGVIATAVISVGLLLFLQYGVILKTIDFAWAVERLFVGTQSINPSVTGDFAESGWGLPKGSGLLFFFLFLALVLIGLVYFTQNRKKLQWESLNFLEKSLFIFPLIPILPFYLVHLLIKSTNSQGFFQNALAFLSGYRVLFNTAALGLIAVLLGYSSYVLIPIRANAGVNINIGNPGTPFTLSSYENREQYGEWPILYGSQFNYASVLRTGEKSNKKKFIHVSEPYLLRDIEDTKSTTGNAPFYNPAKQYTLPLENGKSLIIKDGRLVNKEIIAGASGEYVNVTHASGVPLNINTKTLDVAVVGDRYLWDGYKIEAKILGPKTFFPRMHGLEDKHFFDPSYGFGYKEYVSVYQLDEVKYKAMLQTGYPSQFVEGLRNSIGFAEYNSYDAFLTTLKNLTQNQLSNGEYKRLAILAASPSGLDNLKFFFDYQIGHMYLRYFMWNFVGRESDKQGAKWEHGISFGESNLPDYLKNNKSKNHYFFLPLLLGLFGMIWHFSNKTKDATSVLLLFLFTGIAIVLYLNQKPSEPRERDYSYVGSFQTFCIWIGLGVIGLYDALKTLLKKNTPYVVGLASLLLVPGLMAMQNWDDHNRNSRYVAPDMAYNMLTSCGKNAILFTNGDNDTYPLWYLQEVEGVRTDVRVINLSLLGTEWYMQQLKEPQNESPPLPMTVPQSKYAGTKVFVPFPASELSLKVDSAQIVQNEVLSPEEARNLVDAPISVNIPGGGSGRGVYIVDYIVYNLLYNIAQDGWNRPIHFATTMRAQDYRNLEKYMRQEGLTYRLLPLKNEQKTASENDRQVGGNNISVNEEVSYEKFMNFRFRGLNNPNLYIDAHIRNVIVGSMRRALLRTALKFADKYERFNNEIKSNELALMQLSAQSEDDNPKKDSLKNVLEAKKAELEQKRSDALSKAAKLASLNDSAMPFSVSQYSSPYTLLKFGELFIRVGDTAKGLEYLGQLEKDAEQTIAYYNSLNDPANNQKQVYQFMQYELGPTYAMAEDYASAIKVYEDFLSTYSFAPDQNGQQFKMQVEQQVNQWKLMSGDSSALKMSPAVPDLNTLVPGAVPN